MLDLKIKQVFSTFVVLLLSKNEYTNKITDKLTSTLQLTKEFRFKCQQDTILLTLSLTKNK